MACYFIVDTYMDPDRSRADYDRYIAAVKPIVERFHGEYLARTEHIQCLSEQRQPQRVILIRFPSRQDLDDCFSSAEYQAIMGQRIRTVDARAIIAEGI